MRSTMARPRPVPWPASLVVKKGWKIFSMISGGIAARSVKAGEGALETFSFALRDAGAAIGDIDPDFAGLPRHPDRNLAPPILQRIVDQVADRPGQGARPHRQLAQVVGKEQDGLPALPLALDHAGEECNEVGGHRLFAELSSSVIHELGNDCFHLLDVVDDCLPR